MVGELLSGVVEDLRTECSDTYDVISKVRAGDQSEGVGHLKQLAASSVCALWLLLTPLEHDEFEDVRDLLQEALGELARTSACDVERDDRLLQELRRTLAELMQRCPPVANSRKLRRLIKRALSVGLGGEF